MQKSINFKIQMYISAIDVIFFKLFKFLKNKLSFVSNSINKGSQKLKRHFV